MGTSLSPANPTICKAEDEKTARQAFESFGLDIHPFCDEIVQFDIVVRFRREMIYGVRGCSPHNP
jgi:hypothetical protein